MRPCENWPFATFLFFSSAGNGFERFVLGVSMKFVFFHLMPWDEFPHADQDWPVANREFDPEKGPGFIRETLSAIDKMSLSPQDRKKILSQNAGAVLGLDHRRGE